MSKKIKSIFHLLMLFQVIIVAQDLVAHRLVKIQMHLLNSKFCTSTDLSLYMSISSVFLLKYDVKMLGINLTDSITSFT